MTKLARNEDHLPKTKSGKFPSVRSLPAAEPVDISEPRPARKPRYVNRPAKATEEGYVTVGFRGTKEDDELIRKAVASGGYYSKADLVRKATMELAAKEVGEKAGRELEIAQAAAKLGVDLEEFKESMFQELVRRAKKK